MSKASVSSSARPIDPRTCRPVKVPVQFESGRFEPWWVHRQFLITVYDGNREALDRLCDRRGMLRTPEDRERTWTHCRRAVGREA